MCLFEGISKPHVFHITRRVYDNGEALAEIHTKRFWYVLFSCRIHNHIYHCSYDNTRSLDEHKDPWTQPFVLLQGPINYDGLKHPEMRGPPEKDIESIEKGIATFETFAQPLYEDITQINNMYVLVFFSQEDGTNWFIFALHFGNSANAVKELNECVEQLKFANQCELNPDLADYRWETKNGRTLCAVYTLA